MRTFIKNLSLTCCIWLAGCASQHTPLLQPKTALPEKWETATNAPPAEKPESWWKNFNDPQLNTLVDHALHSNNDVAAAAIRVQRAQLQANLIGTNRNPSVAVGVNTGFTRTFNPSVTSKSSGISAILSYEADLWDKLASQRNAATLETQATEADCRAFAEVLTTTTARLYWQIAYLNQLLSLSDADIDYAQKTLALVHTKHAAGAVSGLNEKQAELNLSNLQAARTQLVQQRVEAQHALALLFNQPPESTVPDRPSLPDTPLPAIAADIPASILANRPDLSSAELRLRESLVHIKVIRTSFYPTLTLTSSLGTASNSLLDLVQNPVATLGAGLFLPFLQWNTAQLNVLISENQYKEAVVNFRQLLYTALAQVEDALSARTQLMAEAEKLDLALAQARQVESITKLRYHSGITEVQLWLDAQLSLRSAERSVINNRYNQFLNQANIYRALGLGAVQGISTACSAERS